MKLQKKIIKQLNHHCYSWFMVSAFGIRFNNCDFIQQITNESRIYVQISNVI